MKPKKYIWLFGENNSTTCNNNSFYFWNHVVTRNDSIEKYFILEKTKKNQAKVKQMPKEKRQYVVWKNTVKHYLLYKKADMFWVSLSYQDISPTKILWKSMKPKVIKPLIYLQHGTLGMKRIGYTGKSYNNNMFRFMIYNQKILQQYQEENHFKPYQLYNARYHPRYQELLRKNEECQKKKTQKQILWFLTWREYFGDNKETQKMINNIKYIVNNTRFYDFLEKNQYQFKICVHQFFDENILKIITENKRKSNIQIVYAKDIDIMEELAKSDVLITDYSSIGFDFTFLGKPVILYQPDLDNYMTNRGFYCSVKEMKQYSIKTSKELIDTLLLQEYKINPFFKERLPENIDYQYVREGKHIDKIYEDLKRVQCNKVTFLGYNFYGIGGTVTATKALAEALLEKGYLVELLSLKKTKKSKPELPNGLNIKALYIAGSRRKKELFKRLFRTDIWYGYLKYDKNKENLIPYTGYALRRKLKSIKSKTVVSTRESLHLFLKDATSEFIKNKLYFFHSDAKVLQENFSTVIERLQKVTLENALFVTRTNQKDYKEIYHYDNYQKSAVIGNTIESRIGIPREQIKPMEEKKKKYSGIILTRISVDRKEDIQNIVEFGKYLKEQNRKNIMIHVYGKGDYLEEFQSLLEENEITYFIRYEGALNNPQCAILESDFVLDLSNQQSFGMIYLEAIFNGKMVFCKRNVGSLETLKEIPECYYETYEELVKKIDGVKQITKEQLQKHYDIIYQKYSRESVADKFLQMIEEEE